MQVHSINTFLLLSNTTSKLKGKTKKDVKLHMTNQVEPTYIDTASNKHRNTFFPSTQWTFTKFIISWAIEQASKIS